MNSYETELRNAARELQEAEITIEEFLSIVKAELGAAIGKDITPHPAAQQLTPYWQGVNWQKSELRNHFGIGDSNG